MPLLDELTLENNDFKKAMLNESNCIKTRRRKQWPLVFAETGKGYARKKVESVPETDADSQNLIGLALSGGGIRSAMFGLGLLQGMYRSGLLRYVDYLSSVSGGSYIAALFTAQVKAQQANPNFVLRPDPNNPKDDLPLAREPDGDKVPSWVPLLQGGQYLQRPLRLAVHYLWGVLGNLLVFGSLFVLACATIAWVWRLLDYQGVVEQFRRLKPSWELDSDLVRAFAPFLVLLAFVIVVSFAIWALRALGRMNANESPRLSSFYRWIRVILWGSLLIGGLIVLANGDTSFGPVRKAFPGRVSPDASVSSDRVLVDRLSGSQLLQTITAIVVLASAAVPLLVPERFMASGTHPRRPLQYYLFSWVVFMGLLGLPMLGIHYFAREDFSGKAPHKRSFPLRQYFDRQMADEITTIQSQQSFTELARGEWKPSEIRILLRKYLTAIQKECEWLALDENADRVRVLCARFGLDQNNISLGTLQRILDTHPGTESDPLVPDVFTESTSHNQGLRDTARLIIRSLHEHPSHSLDAVGNGRYYAYGHWPADEVGQPYYARAALTPQGQLIDADQAFRLKWMLVAGFIFLLSAAVVDLNATSLHNFYSEQLRGAYLAGHPRYRMKELETWKAGAPFHIICASMNLVGRRANKARTWTFQFTPLHCGSSCPKVATHTELPEFDELGNVLSLSSSAFSPASVGSKSIALLLALVNLRLGQWIFLSKVKLSYCMMATGAIVVAASLVASAWWYVHGWSTNGLTHGTVWTAGYLLAFLFLGFALLKSHRFSGATLARLAPWFLGEAEDRPYAFLSDGGHNDNLALWPLMERRCKLIIACDATEDPSYQFEDLTKLMQRAKMSRNIEFLDLDGNAPLDLRPLIPKALQASKVELEATLEREKRLSESHFVLGQIKYPPDDLHPEGDFSYFVYIKSAVTGREATDLVQYAQRELLFPNDPTMDQLYDDDQSDAYRQLGLAASGSLVSGKSPLLPPDDPGADDRYFECDELWRLLRAAYSKEVGSREPMDWAKCYREDKHWKRQTRDRYNAALRSLNNNTVAIDDLNPNPRRSHWTPYQRASLLAVHSCAGRRTELDEDFMKLAIAYWHHFDKVYFPLHPGKKPTLSTLGPNESKFEPEALVVFIYELAERFDIPASNLGRFVLAYLGDAGWTRRPTATGKVLDELCRRIEPGPSKSKSSAEPTALAAWLRDQFEYQN